MALCSNAGGALAATRAARATTCFSVTLPPLVHFTLRRQWCIRPLVLSISGPRVSRGSRIRASAADEEAATEDEGSVDANESEATNESEAAAEAEADETEAAAAGIYEFDDETPMSPEEIKAAYEALYGPSSELRKKGRKAKEASSKEDDQTQGRGRGRRGEDGADGPPTRGGGRQSKDGLEESVVQVRRVTKVVKGGKQLAFRVVTVVGDKKGQVGVGVGKAKEVIAAVQKSVKDARRHMVNVPMTKYKTFPHRADGHYGAADVMLRPAAPGTGVLAGGSVKIVLEMAGIKNALGKQMGGSKNCLNNARATLDAVSQMRHYHEVADLRGIPIEELWK